MTFSDGASSVGGTPTTDRYCGGDQLQASTTATETTVYTNRQPYQVCIIFSHIQDNDSLPSQVGVVIDSTETDTATAGTTENSLGFCIDYAQALC